MSFLNKIFKNRLTGDTFTIIDQYQNVAITSAKEKINTNLLQNDKLFMEVSQNMKPNIMQENYKPKIEDVVDPNKFFSNQSTYNTFAEKIRTIDTSKIKDDPNQSFSSVSGDSGTINYPSTFGNISVPNESAVVMSDPEDEIEELKRKYGATSVSESVRQQNEVFSKILNDPEPEAVSKTEEIVQSPWAQQSPEPVIQKPQLAPQPEQLMNNNPQPVNPVFELFKNVKKNTDFKVKIDVIGKIPRVDFIEMMEDSYEHSIIEWLSTEFTNNILKNPDIIKEKIKSEISKLVYGDKKNSQMPDSVTPSKDEPLNLDTEASDNLPKKTTSRKSKSKTNQVEK